jgi:hypothetical protein
VAEWRNDTIFLDARPVDENGKKSLFWGCGVHSPLLLLIVTITIATAK